VPVHHRQGRPGSSVWFPPHLLSDVGAGARGATHQPRGERMWGPSASAVRGRLYTLW